MKPIDSIFRKYKGYADIRWGPPGRGREIKVGLSPTAIYGVLCGYFFGNGRDKTSMPILCMAICYSLSAC